MEDSTKDTLGSRFYLLPDSPVLDGEAQRVDLSFGEQLVGSVPGIAIHLPYAGVGRMHAALWVQEEVVYVTALDAELCTLVNGTVPEEGKPELIMPGDTLTLGEVTYRLYLGDARIAPAAAPAAAPSSTECEGADQSSPLTELALAEVPTQETASLHLDMLHRLCDGVAQAADDSEVNDVVMALLEEVLPADRYFLMQGSNANTLRLRAARFRDPERGASPQQPISELLRRALSSDEPILVFDAHADERFCDQEHTEPRDVRSAVAVAMVAAGQKTGVLYVDSHAAGRFCRQDSELLATIAKVTTIRLLQIAARRAVIGVGAKARETLANQEALIQGFRDTVVAQSIQMLEILDANDDDASRISRLRQCCWRLQELVESPDQDEVDVEERTMIGVGNMLPSRRPS